MTAEFGTDDCSTVRGNSIRQQGSETDRQNNNIMMGKHLVIDNAFSSITSNYETRPKSKFFSLLIYAGYPIA